MKPSSPSFKLNWNEDVNDGTQGTFIISIEVLESGQPQMKILINRAKIVNTFGNMENARGEKRAHIDTTTLTQTRTIDRKVQRGRNREQEEVAENLPEMGKEGETRLAETHLAEIHLVETRPEGEIHHAERQEETLQEEIRPEEVHHLVILQKEVVVRGARQRTESHPETLRRMENPRMFVGFT